MHDIFIEFLIDIAKGEQSIKIPYLKGKKERIKERGRIMKFIQACQHSFKSLHTYNLFKKKKKINVLSSSKRGRLLTPE